MKYWQNYKRRKNCENSFGENELPLSETENCFGENFDQTKTKTQIKKNFFP